MGQALQIVRPITITAGMLTTNIPEPDSGVSEASWNSGTTYALGDRVVLTSTHRLYESLQAGNTNNNPATATTWWVDVSATNRWRMFDTINSSQSTQATEIDVTIDPGQVVNTLALLNCTAQTIQVVMDDPTDGVVFDQTYDMQSPPLLPDWWNYFFDPITTKSDLIVTLPTYGSATVQAVISHSGTAAVGTMLLGSAVEIGDGVQYGARVGIQDYSRKERNDFGDFVLVERSFAKRADFTMMLPNGQVDAVQNLLAGLRATPTLYIGVQNFGSTVIYGFYKDFDITIQYVEHSVCTLSLEGLT